MFARSRTSLDQLSREMSAVAQVELEEEPIGIVISRGSRAEAAPRFSAFMWSPVPEEVDHVAAEGHRAA